MWIIYFTNIIMKNSILSIKKKVKMFDILIRGDIILILYNTDPH